MNITDELAYDLLDGTPDPLVIVDRAGTIVFANSRAAEAFGYAPDELLGCRVEALLPEGFRAAHAAHRARFFANPKLRPMSGALELYGLRKTGEEFPVEVSLSPLGTSSGPLVSSAIRDITHRIRDEHALIEARREADHANRAKSAFLAAASQDLAQPLQTLMLLNGALAKLAPPGTTMAEIAAREATTLDSMTQRLAALVDICRFDSGAVEPRFVECSVNSIFAELRAQFAKRAEAKGLRFLIDDCEDTVKTDPALIKQAIHNLIANAIHYTKQGLVRLSCLHEQAFVGIEVADTGIGISSHELESIFDEFYRTDIAREERRAGLGIGLTIVRRISQLLQYPIVAESQLGRGSRFILRVPRRNDGLPSLAS